METEAEQPEPMARRRALLTDSERRRIAEDPDEEDQQNYRYQAISRVRNKIQDELPTDVGVLEEHHPDLLGELREVVCPDSPIDDYMRDDYEALLEERDRMSEANSRLAGRIAGLSDRVDELEEKAVRHQTGEAHLSDELGRVRRERDTLRQKLEGERDVDGLQNRLETVVNALESGDVKHALNEAEATLEVLETDD